MKEILAIAKNIPQSPKTSIIGTLMCVFGGYLIYSNLGKHDMTYASVEVLMFAGGLFFLLKVDKAVEDDE